MAIAGRARTFACAGNGLAASLTALGLPKQDFQKACIEATPRVYSKSGQILPSEACGKWTVVNRGQLMELGRVACVTENRKPMMKGAA
jgi:hypothetical protein